MIKDLVFLTEDFDLGKTVVVNKITLTDYTLFKEHYRHIPPGMYEEVKAHLHEVLFI